MTITRHLVVTCRNYYSHSLVIEVVMNKIKVLLNAAQEWEQKVKTALKQK